MSDYGDDDYDDDYDYGSEAGDQSETGDYETHHDDQNAGDGGEWTEPPQHDDGEGVVDLAGGDERGPQLLEICLQRQVAEDI